MKIYRDLIWYRVLPQEERQWLFAVRVGCVVIWPIFSTSKMKAFRIYFYQGNITFKNIITFVEYLEINSYYVTVLDNFRKETSDRAKSIFFWRYSTASLSFWGIHPPPHQLHVLPSWTKVWWMYHFDRFFFWFFFTTSLQVGELCSYFAAAKHSL